MLTVKEYALAQKKSIQAIYQAISRGKIDIVLVNGIKMIEDDQLESTYRQALLNHSEPDDDISLLHSNDLLKIKLKNSKKLIKSLNKTIKDLTSRLNAVDSERIKKDEMLNNLISQVMHQLQEPDVIDLKPVKKRKKRKKK